MFLPGGRRILTNTQVLDTGHLRGSNLNDVGGKVLLMDGTMFRMKNDELKTPTLRWYRVDIEPRYADRDEHLFDENNLNSLQIYSKSYLAAKRAATKCYIAWKEGIQFMKFRCSPYPRCIT